jgi:acyl-coenzyme A thioesterase PaaI-like protein
MEYSPLIGKSTAVGPEMKIEVKNGVGRATVTFDWRFEGPPRCVHGGYVAAAFDELLGWAQSLSGDTGATKNLSVTYHRPTPLNQELTLEARFVSREGRKIFMTGEMYAGDVHTASAEGLFIGLGARGTEDLHQNL